jgi:hypothetical protein
MLRVLSANVPKPAMAQHDNGMSMATSVNTFDLHTHLRCSCLTSRVFNMGTLWCTFGAPGWRFSKSSGNQANPLSVLSLEPTDSQSGRCEYLGVDSTEHTSGRICLMHLPAVEVKKITVGAPRKLAVALLQVCVLGLLMVLVRVGHHVVRQACEEGKRREACIHPKRHPLLIFLRSTMTRHVADLLALGWPALRQELGCGLRCLHLHALVYPETNVIGQAITSWSKRTMTNCWVASGAYPASGVSLATTTALTSIKDPGMPSGFLGVTP